MHTAVYGMAFVDITTGCLDPYEVIKKSVSGAYNKYVTIGEK